MVLYKDSKYSPYYDTDTKELICVDEMYEDWKGFVEDKIRDGFEFKDSL